MHLDTTNSKGFIYTTRASGTAYPLAFGVEGTEYMRLCIGGNLNICCCLVVAACGTAIDWIATSSIKIKTDITPINNALSIINKLQGICYKMCDDTDKKCKIGLIAEYVEPILPSVVHYDINGDISGISYDKMVALLIEGIKEQQKHIEKQDRDIICLRQDLNYYKNYNI